MMPGQVSSMARQPRRLLARGTHTPAARGEGYALAGESETSRPVLVRGVCFVS
jgi:hypothetical protein